ncbi:Gp19/Gp15/Gp42 family protein [Mobiluncus mulieris]|uniref:Gp19/Gp15/Gp42 family protein n=1 Tax=Mobiluncus mulieris TaxID=2052 RepID=UPI0014702E94|nr:Gp19/Gp15/Gp42 family protein [Mobiluncus mulieris]NMX11164.1 hypothetical protein [Mobiluncus mulieris]
MATREAELRKSATIEDVEAILVRQLTGNEKVFVERLLGRAQRVITRELSEAGVSPDPRLVFDVQASMVARALVNSTGKTQESDGQYSYMMADRSVAGDGLYLTARDRDLLGIAGEKGFLWNPQYGASPRVSGDDGEENW